MIIVTYQVWKPSRDRYILINSLTDDLYEVHRTVNGRLSVQSTTSMLKGEFERVSEAVVKFDTLAADVVRPEGLIMKVSV